MDDVSRRRGEWLKGTGPESDIVLSSRVRLARNVEGFPFIAHANSSEKSDLEVHIRDRIMKLALAEGMLYYSLIDSSNVDRNFLMERHLISREHAEAEGERGVAFGEEESISIMVNEEDHLRIQVIQTGLQLRRSWDMANECDDAIEGALNYSFSSQFGYLTACPTTAGTGLRVSALLHLPALVFTEHIEKVFHAVSKINVAVRGLMGEGTQASGNLYQISNQVTLGRSEEELIESVERVIPQIIDYERSVREELNTHDRLILEDRICRAHGILQSARKITSQETMELLSALRLGVTMGLLTDFDTGAVNELFILTQPAHLQKLAGRELEPNERDIERARFIRQSLGMQN